jgi:hypothetical protein
LSSTKQGLYLEDPAFDLSVWKDDVEGKAQNKSCPITSVVDAVRKGNRSTAEILTFLDHCSLDGQRTLNEASEKGYLEKVRARAMDPRCKSIQPLNEPPASSEGPLARTASAGHGSSQNLRRSRHRLSSSPA